MTIGPAETNRSAQRIIALQRLEESSQTNWPQLQEKLLRFRSAEIDWDLSENSSEFELVIKTFFSAFRVFQAVWQEAGKQRLEFHPNILKAVIAILRGNDVEVPTGEGKSEVIIPLAFLA